MYTADTLIADITRRKIENDKVRVALHNYRYPEEALKELRGVAMEETGDKIEKTTSRTGSGEKST